MPPDRRLLHGETALVRAPAEPSGRPRQTRSAAQSLRRVRHGSAVALSLVVLVGSWLALLGSCTPATRSPGGSAPRPVATWRPEACAGSAGAARDEDADGLADLCELALAERFAPELVADPRDCIWTAGPRSGYLRGGYLFAAHPVEPEMIRLVYLTGYSRDCGWWGLRCMLASDGCSAHTGDSELVAVDVRHGPAAGGWVAEGVFLTAHCLGASAGSCRWFRGKALADLTWPEGREQGPRIWVARGKHAHYPTREACDRGRWLFDSCDGNSVAYRFPVLSLRQNIGSRGSPRPGMGGCLGGDQILPLPAVAGAAVRECVWDEERRFNGWEAEALGKPPTPYGRLLRVLLEI